MRSLRGASPVALSRCAGPEACMCPNPPAASTLPLDQRCHMVGDVLVAHVAVATSSVWRSCSDSAAVPD